MQTLASLESIGKATDQSTLPISRTVNVKISIMLDKRHRCLLEDIWWVKELQTRGHSETFRAEWQGLKRQLRLRG